MIRFSAYRNEVGVNTPICALRVVEKFDAAADDVWRWSVESSLYCVRYAHAGFVVGFATIICAAC